MPGDDLKEVSLRLERLEAKLGAIAPAAALGEITAEDVKAFHKVQAAFWEDGSCGINETSPCIFRCHRFDGERVVKLDLGPTFLDLVCTREFAAAQFAAAQINTRSLFGRLGG